jgi:hypothetical protein
MKHLNTLCSMGKHEAGLTQCKVSLCHLEILLVLLDFDHKMGDVVVNLSVARDLSCQAPIISLGHCVLKKVEVTSWSGEQVAEPCR